MLLVLGKSFLQFNFFFIGLSYYKPIKKITSEHFNSLYITYLKVKFIKKSIQNHITHISITISNVSGNKKVIFDQQFSPILIFVNIEIPEEY